MIEVRTMTDAEIVHDLLGVLTFAYNRLPEEDKKVIKSEVDRIMNQGGLNLLLERSFKNASGRA